MSKKNLELNMRVLKRTRRPIDAGDIFALQILPDCFHFGRVVETGLDVITGEDILVYLYKQTSKEKHKIPDLSRDDLLVPPLIVAKFMWTRGYFEPVEKRPLSPGDVFDQHCFRWEILPDPSWPEYTDQYRNRLDRRTEPCGSYSLALEGAVDNRLSDALGIPRCKAWQEEQSHQS